MSDDHDHNHTPAHSHDHSHSHGGHAHSHAPANFNRAFAVGIALNTGFVAIEAFYGWQINSLALLANAGHNLSDVAGLGRGVGRQDCAKRPPHQRLQARHHPGRLCQRATVAVGHGWPAG